MVEVEKPDQAEQQCQPAAEPPMVELETMETGPLVRMEKDVTTFDKWRIATLETTPLNLEAKPMPRLPATVNKGRGREKARGRQGPWPGMPRPQERLQSALHGLQVE